MVRSAAAMSRSCPRRISRWRRRPAMPRRTSDYSLVAKIGTRGAWQTFLSQHPTDSMPISPVSR